MLVGIIKFDSVRQFITSLLFLSSLIVLADTSPKFSNKSKLKFYKDNVLITDFDSICAVVKWPCHGCGIDTAIINCTLKQYWLGATLDKNEDSYDLVSFREIESFTVILFKDGKKYESGIIAHFPGCSLYTFNITKNLIDTSPLLNIEWYKYFYSLLMTLTIEFLIGTIFFMKHKSVSVSLGQFIISFILINMLTHFSLWFAHSHVRVGVFLLEIVVMCVETVYWKVLLSSTIKKSLLISVVNNLASWLIGGIILLWIGS